MTSQSTSITQPSSGDGITTPTVQSSQNSVMALNLSSNISSIPTLPQMALQMPGLGAVQVPALPQQFQPNAGGGIIVLNVGNGNNLAAAISQLVAGGLVQQQQQPQLQIVQPAVVPVPVVQTVSSSQTTSSANFVGITQVPATNNPIASSTTVQSLLASTTSMNVPVNNPAVQQIVNTNQQQPMVMPQTSMMLNTPMQFSIPAQQPQQQQPAAFMLVPIPQTPQGNPGSPFMNISNQVQQPQQLQTAQQLLANYQNQVMGSYPTQTQIQNMHNMAHGIAFNQQQQTTAGLQMTNLVSRPLSASLPSSPMLASTLVQHLTQPQTTQSFPRTDELRAFLTKSTKGNVTTQTLTSDQSSSVTQTILGSPVSSSTFNQLTSSNLTNVVSQSPTPTPTTPVQRQAAATLAQLSPQFQPMVSSPGLAFLAQVSSFTADQQLRQIGSTASTTSYSRECQSSPVFQQTQTYTSLGSNEVNNNSLLSPPLNLSKPHTPVTESCSTSSESMTVSSTTKLGDDGVPVIFESIPSSSVESSDIMLHEITATNEFQFQGELNIDERSGSDNKVTPEKRKREPLFPPVVKEKRKKGPAPKLDGTETCLICGDHASGYHYNTLSCEGCKGFFRRTVIKGANYHCKLSSDCQMDLYTRRKCQKCRYEKCKTVGMREECVLSEEKKKLKRECDSTNIPVRSLSSDDSSVPSLTPQQRNLLELLKANERRFQWPATEDMKKVTVWVEDDDSIHSRALRFAHFTELCILMVQLVVEFTKQLPGFLTVLREDQIVLLKACAIEVLLLRAAKQYNKHDGTINFLNGMLYDKSCFYRAGMQVEFVDPIFQFCNSMAQLELDETEYAILVAINTFSTDRPQIKDIEKVECMQDPYVELLRVYCKIRHPNDPLMFARILMKMVELRTLNNYHSEQMFALKVQDRKLPPLLAEIWDM